MELKHQAVREPKEPRGEGQLETDGGSWPRAPAKLPASTSCHSCEAILDFPAFPAPWLTPREAEECCGQLSES